MTVREVAHAVTVLDVLADLMNGGRHTRHSVARYGVSLPTADRWLKALETTIPGVVKLREGRTSVYAYRAHVPK